jgi:cytoskeletal protein CcmA (bactofilin family)
MNGDTTIINKGITIKGEISGPAAIEVLGRIEGTARTDSSLHVKSGGQVSGTLSAKQVIIEGDVDAQISGDAKVELRASAKVRGDIKTKALVITEGASFDGKIQMT